MVLLGNGNGTRLPKRSNADDVEELLDFCFLTGIGVVTGGGDRFSLLESRRLGGIFEIVGGRVGCNGG